MKAYDKESYLVVTQGSSHMISEGAKALEALADLLAKISTDDNQADVAEIAIWENTPIKAIVTNDFGASEYGWNGDRWIILL